MSTCVDWPKLAGCTKLTQIEKIYKLIDQKKGFRAESAYYNGFTTFLVIVPSLFLHHDGHYSITLARPSPPLKLRIIVAITPSGEFTPFAFIATDLLWPTKSRAMVRGRWPDLNSDWRGGKTKLKIVSGAMVTAARQSDQIWPVAEDEDEQTHGERQSRRRWQPLLDLATDEPKREQPWRGGSAMDGSRPWAATTGMVG